MEKHIGAITKFSSFHYNVYLLIKWFFNFSMKNIECSQFHSYPEHDFKQMSWKYLFTKSKDKIPPPPQKKKCIQKVTKLLLKIIPECTKLHRLVKIFRGACPRTPPRIVSQLRRSYLAFCAQFLPHQPKIDGYVSDIYIIYILSPQFLQAFQLAAVTFT